MDTATSAQGLTLMPQFQSHKKVWALKIERVVLMHDAKGEKERTDATLYFEGQVFAPKVVELNGKPTPEAGWYMIQYEDGYISFSPAKQFEEGYTLIGKPNLVTTTTSAPPVPTIARTVHYQSYGTPNGEYNSLARAAIITEVDSPGSATSHVGLCVLNPTGQFFNQHVPYSEKPQPGCWSWPPRV